MMEFHKAAIEANKQQQNGMDEFAFFEDQPAGTILQLAAPVLPLHLHPYLQLAQPNIHQDSLPSRDPKP